MNPRIGIAGVIVLFAFSAVSLRGEDSVHVVAKGETIYSIARSFNIDKDDLMKYNGISDPTRLKAGQRLSIPGAAKTAAISAPGAAASGLGGISGGEEVFHHAVKGDTMYGIARKYGVALGDLMAANSLDSGYVLKQGDMLRIPGKGGTESPKGAPGAAVAAQPPKAAPSAGQELPAPAKSSPPRPTETRVVDASLRWPVEARDLSYMTGKLSGVVITGRRAELVKSLTRGTVISAGPYRGFGRVAIIQVEGGYLYVYGGCESLSVKEGDSVKPGMEVGKLGIDAVSEKPQLFFLVYRNNKPIDPAQAPRE
jgi:murein DD-endopeptidase MepM/ murein hydrolase activator NlpD